MQGKKLSGKEIKNILKCMEDTFGNVSALAKRTGHDRNTIKKYLKQELSLTEAWDEEKQKTVDYLENELLSLVKNTGNPQLLMFALRNLHPEKWNKDRHYRIEVKEELHEIFNIQYTRTDGKPSLAQARKESKEKWGGIVEKDDTEA